jgi:ABC-type uncharacterized transport system ATPase subunit
MSTGWGGCRLPMPRPGQVLGLVGTNGIGKSTALKVLAGKLKPNLGRFEVQPRRMPCRHCVTLQDGNRRGCCLDLISCHCGSRRRKGRQTAG